MNNPQISQMPQILICAHLRNLRIDNGDLTVSHGKSCIASASTPTTAASARSGDGNFHSDPDFLFRGDHGKKAVILDGIASISIGD